MKQYLHLLETLIEEAPRESFTNPLGEVLDREVFRVTFKKGEGPVDLAALRAGCLEQLDDRETEVTDWINHQKTEGGAKEDTIVFSCEETDAILHIIFIEDDKE